MKKRTRTLVAALAAAVALVSLAIGAASLVLGRAPAAKRGVEIELAQAVSADFSARLEELLRPHLSARPGTRVRVTYRPDVREEGGAAARGAHLVLRPMAPSDASGAMPVFTADYMVLAYDRAHVAEPPASFQDLMRQALSLKAKGEVVYGVGIPEEEYGLLPFFSDVFWTAPGDDAKMAARRAFALLGELRFTYGLSPHACTSDCVARLLAERQTPFAMVGEWRLPELRRALGEDLGVAPLPSLVHGGPPLRSVRRTYGLERAPALEERESSAAEGVIAYLRGDGRQRLFAALGRVPVAGSPGEPGEGAEERGADQEELDRVLRAPGITVGEASVRAAETALASLWTDFADGRLGVEGAARALAEKALAINPVANNEEGR